MPRQCILWAPFYHEGHARVEGDLYLRAFRSMSCQCFKLITVTVACLTLKDVIPENLCSMLETERRTIGIAKKYIWFSKTLSTPSQIFNSEVFGLRNFTVHRLRTATHAPVCTQMHANRHRNIHRHRHKRNNPLAYAQFCCTARRCLLTRLILMLFISMSPSICSGTSCILTLFVWPHLDTVWELIDPRIVRLLIF